MRAGSCATLPWPAMNGRPARSAGVIITMSSVHESIPWAGHINYASAKGGVHMFTRTLRKRLQPTGSESTRSHRGHQNTHQQGRLGER